MTCVKFNYADVSRISLPNKRRVQHFVAQIFTFECKELQFLNYVFCSDPYILEINRQFLQHDYFTDIITFDMSETTSIIGELYISVETVQSNAALHGVHYHNELLRVIFHGALHLCGYSDKKKSEITEMKGKEEYYLQTYLQIK